MEHTIVIGEGSVWDAAAAAAAAAAWSIAVIGEQLLLSVYISQNLTTGFPGSVRVASASTINGSHTGDDNWSSLEKVGS